MLAKIKTLIKNFGENKKYALVAGAFIALTATAAISLSLLNADEPEEKGEFYKKAEYSINQNSIVGNNLVKSYALYVDGEFVAVCENSEVAEEAVETVKNLSAAFYGAEPEDAQVVNDIQIAEGYYKADGVADEEELLSILGVEGNTINSEGLKLDLSYTVLETQEEVVPFDILYLDAKYRTEGYTRTLQDGKDGAKLVNYSVTYINGSESNKVVESEYIINEQKPAIIEKGTGGSATKTSASLNLFSLPYVGHITSRFGWRMLYGAPDNHDGIDITHPINGFTCYGDPIKAAGDGKVIFSGYSSGYGNYVIIQHENGMQTGYAHMSKIVAFAGQDVKTGDIIGNIGSTGKSTGPHLHFEVIIGGEKKDPMMFLKDTDLLN
ncbi:MAG: peptidoglycan DD-metalloendopeptidase family protein [Eubacteriales bacterium]|nr:peptidoglycan DD-metalloendopeptidase family protein [Eubacteriales bacterium]MDD4474756.1 peptidoglycan DD-metalloendopeptidase family protein [Eubacteriales bacterium]